MNFMLKPSHTFQVIIPAVGNSMLLKTSLKAFTRSSYTGKLSHITVRLHVSQLDDFRQTIEQFFESWDRLTDFGFSDFRVGKKCLGCTLPHGSLRLLCQIRAKKLTFDTCGELESVISKNLKILLNFDLDEVQAKLFIVVNILSFDFCFLTFRIQFTASVLETLTSIGRSRCARPGFSS
jgi:hypothetical protein